MQRLSNRGSAYTSGCAYLSNRGSITKAPPLYVYAGGVCRASITKVCSNSSSGLRCMQSLSKSSSAVLTLAVWTYSIFSYLLEPS
jgi:hypothetical protein